MSFVSRIANMIDELFASSSSPRLGSLNVPPYLPVPRLPAIVGEWAAIVPLVLHLATVRSDYETAGRVALLGRLSIGLFPKLGTFAGLSSLLTQGPEYLDNASGRSGSGSTVWDVTWGNRFPAMNGACPQMLIKYALAHQKDARVRYPEEDAKRPAANEKSSVNCDASNYGRPFRYQVLHVINCRQHPKKHTIHQIVERILNESWFAIFSLVSLLGIAVVLCLLGIYGTAAIIGCCALAEYACRQLTIFRPPGYLSSNESYQTSCMLVGSHQNVATWYLLVGDRSVVDTVLNKTMIELPETRYRGALIRILQFTHLVQIVAMTFVAAQKGWDGVSLVVLIGVNRLFRLRRRDDGLVKQWLEQEGVSMEAHTFKFTGRTVMLGAIHTLSGASSPSWMDEIICPHPRREAWLKNLDGETVDPANWNKFDLEWINFTAKATKLGSEALKKDFEALAKIDH